METGHPDTVARAGAWVQARGKQWQSGLVFGEVVRLNAQSERIARVLRRSPDRGDDGEGQEDECATGAVRKVRSQKPPLRIVMRTITVSRAPTVTVLSTDT